MLTILDTPFAGRPGLPRPRDDGWNPELIPAVFPGAAAAVAKLGAAGALVVTTGQQPGLFTGPLYTIYKALSARALAIALERRWNRPVVPVFWVAGDDHDFAEASTAAWFGPDGGLITAALEPRPAAAPLRSMTAEPVPARAIEMIDDLATALSPGPAREATIAWLSRHYRPGTTLAAASGGALAELLGPLGIVCFDASAPAAKRAAAPVVLAALRQALLVDELLVRRAEELGALGISTEVKIGDGASLAFVTGAEGRDRLVRDGAGFRSSAGKEHLTLVDLERIARAEPDRLSPNVLLRPVVESALLPTVAYVAGPAELRYLELAAVLYQPLGIVRPLPVPRWSGLVIEPRVARTLEKFGAQPADLLDPASGLETRVLKSLAPADFDPAFADLRRAIEAGFERVVAVAKGIDPTLEKPAGGAMATAAGVVADLEKRLLQAQKRRQGELIAQLERARTAVRPGGAEQERVIGFPALSGRYGLELMDPLAHHVAAWYDRALEGDPATP